MMVKLELMMVKCQLKANTNKNRFSLPTEFVERAMNISFFVSSFFFFLISEFPRFKSFFGP